MDSSEERALAFVDPNSVVESLSVRPGMRVADIGAGSGAYTVALAKKVGDSGKVYAIDLQKEMLSRIVSEAGHAGVGETVEVVWGDIDRKGGSKLADGILDMALLSNTLFQLEDKEAAFLEIHRTLKKGGLLVVVEWSDSFNNIGPHKDEVVTKVKASQLADAAGFSVKREFDAGAHHYGLVLQSH